MIGDRIALRTILEQVRKVSNLERKYVTGFVKRGFIRAN